MAQLSYTGLQLDQAIRKVRTDYADVSGVTATAEDVLQGKTFVGANKLLIVGTLEPGGARLNAPTIILNGTVITLEDGNNGNFTTGFEILVDGVVSATTTTTAFDLTTLGLVSGTYSITAKAYGTGMITSVPSNSVSYTPSAQSNFLLSNGDILETSDHNIFNVNE